MACLCRCWCHYVQIVNSNSNSNVYNPNAQRWMNCDGEAKEKSTTKTFTLKSQSLIYTRNIFYLSIVFQSGVAFRHYYNGSIFVDCSQFVFFMTQKAHMFFLLNWFEKIATFSIESSSIFGKWLYHRMFSFIHSGWKLILAW